MKFSILLLSILVSQAASALGGTTVGNGGDDTRGMFIKMGQAVLRYLATEPGKALVKEHELDMKKLEGTLSIHGIKTSKDPLTDNTGSIVDSLGVPGMITLFEDSWERFYDNNRDVYYLVFHEMLRSAGVNDDNNVISNVILPFPEPLKIPMRPPHLQSGIYWPLKDEYMCDGVFYLSADGRTLFSRIPGSQRGVRGGSNCPAHNNVVALRWNGTMYDNNDPIFREYISIDNDHCITSTSPIGTNQFCLVVPLGRGSPPVLATGLFKSKIWRKGN